MRRIDPGPPKSRPARGLPSRTPLAQDPKLSRWPDRPRPISSSARCAMALSSPDGPSERGGDQIAPPPPHGFDPSVVCAESPPFGVLHRATPQALPPPQEDTDTEEPSAADIVPGREECYPPPPVDPGPPKAVERAERQAVGMGAGGSESRCGRRGRRG